MERPCVGKAMFSLKTEDKAAGLCVIDWQAKSGIQSYYICEPYIIPDYIDAILVRRRFASPYVSIS